MTTIVRTGRQRSVLAADPRVTAAVLADPAAVTVMLGDLIDQRHSDLGPPIRWTVPGVRIGRRRVGTTLAPVFTRDGLRVRIDAPSTPDSDATGRIVLDVEAQGATAPPAGGTVLTTDWQLELTLGLPRAALALAGPAIDRGIEHTVQQIMRRVALAVDGT